MKAALRPGLVVFVTGTGTEIGKTWVGAALLGLARSRGLAAAARKPAQSYEVGAGADGRPVTDADQLAAATGEEPDLVCPPARCYPVPMAPPMAAEVLGRPVPTLAELAGEVSGSWTDPVADLGLVEGAGGIASPLAADGDSADLARLLGADVVVLVADPELGVISSVRLAARAVAGRPLVVHLNRYRPDEDLHRRNRAWLAEREGLTVTTTVEGLLAAVLATPRS